MTPSAAFQLVDLHDSGTVLTVQWRSAPGAHARPVDAVTLDRIGKQVTALAAAERHAGLARDIVVPSLLAPSGPGRLRRSARSARRSTSCSTVLTAPWRGGS